MRLCLCVRARSGRSLSVLQSGLDGIRDFFNIFCCLLFFGNIFDCLSNLFHDGWRNIIEGLLDGCSGLLHLIGLKVLGDLFGNLRRNFDRCSRNFAFYDSSSRLLIGHDGFL